MRIDSVRVALNQSRDMYVIFTVEIARAVSWSEPDAVLHYLYQRRDFHNRMVVQGEKELAALEGVDSDARK